MHKKRSIKDYENHVAKANQNQKIKTLIDFDENNSNCIKSLAVKKNTTVKVRSRFMNGKMLMFVKVTLASFIDDVIDVFAFPNEYVRDIFYKNNLIKCCLYLILRDTNTAALFFVFVCKIHCSITILTRKNKF